MIILGITASSDKNAPDAPTIGTATDVGTGRAYNNAAVTVTFTAPTYSGGSPITSYTVTSNTGGYTATGASSPLTVTGIPSNTTLTFTVTATNASGFTSPASSASNSVTATTVPQAPTIGTATAGDASATVTYTAGATGGKAVSVYTATSSPGSFTGTGSSPITVSGLSNGTAYTFTVTATNANGTSAASAASNSITPAASGSWNSITSFVASGGENSITISSIPNTYTHLLVRSVILANSTALNRLSFTNSNYNWQIGGTWSNDRFEAQQTNQSFCYIDHYNGSVSDTNPSISEIIFPYYSATGTAKAWQSMGGTAAPTLANTEYILGGGMAEVGTAAISSISFTRSGGSFLAGTVIAVYGLSA